MVIYCKYLISFSLVSFFAFSRIECFYSLRSFPKETSSINLYILITLNNKKIFYQLLCNIFHCVRARTLKICLFCNQLWCDIILQATNFDSAMKRRVFKLGRKGNTVPLHCPTEGGKTKCHK